MSHVQFEVRQDVVGLHELFFCLAGEPNDDVGRDGATGNLQADFLDKSAILLLGVATFHIAEYFVVACLNRNFDVWHHFGKFGDRVHQIFPKIIWVRGQEANTFDAFRARRVMHDAQQTREIGPVRDILAVAIDDLAEERYFLDALCGERADLRDDVAHRAAALDPAPEGDDAKCTGMGAAINDRHVRADQVSAFMPRQDELLIHHQETARRFRVFQRTDLSLTQV